MSRDEWLRDAALQLACTYLGSSWYTDRMEKAIARGEKIKGIPQMAAETAASIWSECEKQYIGPLPDLPPVQKEG